jgi:hypothetical protein
MYVQNSSILEKRRSTVSLLRKPSMLEGGKSSALCTVRTDLACEWNNWDLKVLKWDNH